MGKGKRDMRKRMKKGKGFYLLRSEFGKKLSEVKREKESLLFWTSFVMKMEFDDDRMYVMNFIG